MVKDSARVDLCGLIYELDIGRILDRDVEDVAFFQLFKVALNTFLSRHGDRRTTAERFG